MSEVSGQVQVFLKLTDSGEKIILSDSGEYTLGRSDVEQPTQGEHKSVSVRADIDLSPYNAYELGVSRSHARIVIQPGRVTLTDLDSTNRTRINGSTLTPFTPSVLHDNDLITLGKLKLQITIQRE